MFIKDGSQNLLLPNLKKYVQNLHECIMLITDNLSIYRWIISIYHGKIYWDIKVECVGLEHPCWAGRPQQCSRSAAPVSADNGHHHPTWIIAQARRSVSAWLDWVFFQGPTGPGCVLGCGVEWAGPSYSHHLDWGVWGGSGCQCKLSPP